MEGGYGWGIVEMQTPPGRAGADPAGNRLEQIPGGCFGPVQVCEDGRVCWLGSDPPWDVSPRLWSQSVRLPGKGFSWLNTEMSPFIHTGTHCIEGWLLPFPGRLLWKEPWPFASLLSVN